MSKRRPIARAFFLVSLAVLLGSIFRFTRRQPKITPLPYWCAPEAALCATG